MGDFKSLLKAKNNKEGKRFFYMRNKILVVLKSTILGRFQATQASHQPVLCLDCDTNLNKLRCCNIILRKQKQHG